MLCVALRVCLRFCVLLLTLSLPVHQNAHVDSVCEKVYSSRCLFYFRCSTVNILKYKGKHLLTRIPRASHGSFNPFVMLNKHAHIINGYIPVRILVFKLLKRCVTIHFSRFCDSSQHSITASFRQKQIPFSSLQYYFRHSRSIL